MGATSNFDRLRKLPAVFSGAELARALSISPESFFVYVSRLKKAEFIRPLGGHSDIYFNLVRDLQWEKHLRHAIARAIPSAIELGANPLYNAGWSTQRPKKLEVAVLSNGKGARSKFDTVSLSTRRPRWFEAVTHGEGIAASSGGLLTLKPAWALADAALSPSADDYRPGPDELYLDSAGARETQEFCKAAKLLSKAFGVKIEFSPSDGMLSMYTTIFEGRGQTHGLKGSNVPGTAEQEDGFETMDI